MDFKDSHYICIYDPKEGRRDFSYLSPKGMRKYGEDNGLPGLEARDAQGMKNLSDYLCIYDGKRKKKKWLWGLLTNKGIVKYAKEMKYDTGMRLFGMNQRRAEEAFSEFYHMSITRHEGEEWLNTSIFTKKYDRWKNMTGKQLVEFARGTGMGRSEICERYPGLYNKLRVGGMLDSVVEKKRRDWTKMKCSDMVECAKELGFYKGGASNATGRDSGFARAVYRKGFNDRIFKPQKKGRPRKHPGK